VCALNHLHELSTQVRELQAMGFSVVFVGDGVNDAPALVQADVGVAIGTGTDVAIEAADIVMMKDTLHDVLTTLHLCRATMARIRINFVWAFVFNVCGIPLAAGILYPVSYVQFPPMFAGAAMVSSSVLVVCSSLMLKLYEPPKLDGHT
jgi:Cu+-exporting ATPase